MYWYKTVGKRGYGIAVRQRSKQRNIELKWWDRERKTYRTRTLGHRDRERALEEAKHLAGELLAGKESERDGTITLRQLLQNYCDKCSHLKKGDQPREDERRRVLWSAILGDREIGSLTKTDLATFVKDRREGTIRLSDHVLRSDVSDTTIGADIVFLQTAMNWAIEQHYLENNPLRGYKRLKTARPKRPVGDYDRYLQLQTVTDRVDPRFGVFMTLVEALGWRVSAICQLRAEDILRKSDPDAPHGRIRKVRQTDKKRVEMWIPLAEDVRRALDRLPVLKGYLFPSPKRADKPWARYRARDLLERAEGLAGLEPIEGGDFHPYRRKWATERKHLPTKDVMAAGGWDDPRSLETCYQDVDAETLYAVVTEPRKLRKKALGGRHNGVHNGVHERS